MAAFADTSFDVGAFSNSAFDLGTLVLVTVPDVVGDTQAAGTATLEGVLFVVAVQTAYSSSVAAGLIISQSPTGGTDAIEGSTVTITVSLGEAPALNAAGSSRKRKRLYVEVDGQQFQVESAQQAKAILERAKQLATQAATDAATEIEVKRKPVSRIDAVKLKAPEIKASHELKLDLAPVREQIAKVYDQAAMELELRLLLQRQAEQDEEEAIFLLM